MARTPGATNRTPRELRAEAERLLEKAAYIERIEKLKKREADAKAKARGK
ncbi:hypothetical protein [Microbacterium paludicola]|nr:hypothetical protein [Microbacterium paludicola]